MASRIVDGFLYTDPGAAHDGEVVEVVARVKDRRVLDFFGPAFLVRFIGGEVGLALATTLKPWFLV